MNVTIRNTKTHRSTVYTEAELRANARRLAKGKGRLVGFTLEIFEGSGICQILVECVGKDTGRPLYIGEVI